MSVSSIILCFLFLPHLVFSFSFAPSKMSPPSLYLSSCPPLISPLLFFLVGLPSFLISFFPSFTPSLLSICNQTLSVTVGLFVYQLQGHAFAKNEITEGETMWWSSPSLPPLSFVCSPFLSSPISSVFFFFSAPFVPYLHRHTCIHLLRLFLLGLAFVFIKRARPDHGSGAAT